MQQQKFILILLLTVIVGCKTKNENNKVEPIKPTEIITQNNLPKDIISKIDTTVQLEKEVTLIDSSFTKKSNEDATNDFIRKLKSKGITEIFNFKSFSTSMVGFYQSSKIFWTDKSANYLTTITTDIYETPNKMLGIYTYKFKNTKTLNFVAKNFYELRNSKILDLDIKLEKEDDNFTINSNGSVTGSIYFPYWKMHPTHYGAYSFDIHSINGFISQNEIYNNSFDKYDNGNTWTKNSKPNINYNRNINSKRYALLKLAEAEIDGLEKFIVKK